MDVLGCPFEKTLLGRRFGCSRATRHYIAERELGGCADVEAQARCRALLDRLHENARFVLRLTGPVGHLPHGKEMKIQFGGLLGLQAVLRGEDVAALSGEERVDDIHGTIDRAVEAYGGLGGLPYQEIIKAMASYQHRRHKPGR